MKKIGAGRISALVAAGTMILSGFFSSCSIFDSDDTNNNLTYLALSQGGGTKLFQLSALPQQRQARQEL